MPENGTVDEDDATLLNVASEASDTTPSARCWADLPNAERQRLLRELALCVDWQRHPTRHSTAELQYAQKHAAEIRTLLAHYTAESTEIIATLVQEHLDALGMVFQLVGNQLSGMVDTMVEAIVAAWLALPPLLRDATYDAVSLGDDAGDGSGTDNDDDDDDDTAH